MTAIKDDSSVLVPLVIVIMVVLMMEEVDFLAAAAAAAAEEDHPSPILLRLITASFLETITAEPFHHFMLLVTSPMVPMSTHIIVALLRRNITEVTAADEQESEEQILTIIQNTHHNNDNHEVDITESTVEETGLPMVVDISILLLLLLLVRDRVDLHSSVDPDRDRILLRVTTVIRHLLPPRLLLRRIPVDQDRVLLLPRIVPRRLDRVPAVTHERERNEDMGVLVVPVIDTPNVKKKVVRSSSTRKTRRKNNRRNNHARKRIKSLENKRKRKTYRSERPNAPRKKGQVEVLRAVPVTVVVVVEVEVVPEVVVPNEIEMIFHNLRNQKIHRPKINEPFSSLNSSCVPQNMSYVNSYARRWAYLKSNKSFFFKIRKPEGIRDARMWN